MIRFAEGGHVPASRETKNKFDTRFSFLRAEVRPRRPGIQTKKILILMLCVGTFFETPLLRNTVPPFSTRKSKNNRFRRESFFIFI
jgi:hypothetical protein